MRGVFYVLTALAVFGLAFWAYRENYATQQVLADTRNLQQNISAARARLNVLKAEWAYLNRPDRLMDLTEANFDRLGLLPLRPDQFGHIDEIPYPPVAEMQMMNVIALASDKDGGAPTGLVQVRATPVQSRAKTEVSQ